MAMNNEDHTLGVHSLTDEIKELLQEKHPKTREVTEEILLTGPIRTCAGLKAGIEASIHAMREIYQNDETEAILLVNAENAFNNLNRRAALHNIRE